MGAINYGLHKGIIPARAGFTPAATGEPGSPQDHPRSRGVYIRTVVSSIGGVGSSPLARGLHGRYFVPGQSVGIIPARAGFTRALLRETGDPRDHPRSRGVYRTISSARSATPGSSPLARGLLVSSFRLCAHRWIIPARAGFT